jgi:hypothetical protein
MKQLVIFCAFIFSALIVQAQDYKTDLSNARTAYTSGKLEDAHFALQQAIAEVDILTGKQVLKILPQKMDVMDANTAADNVFANVGFVGATIHRTWGQAAQTAELDIINNSPMIGTINAFLNTPFMGMMSSDKSKMVKVQGYKARLNNDGAGANGMSNYSLQIPLSGALITFKVMNTNDAAILSMANTLPLAQIAKLIQ